MEVNSKILQKVSRNMQENDHRFRDPEHVSKTKNVQHSTKGQPTKRCEVQFRDGSQCHFDTNGLAQAKYYARSLANFNHAAQVYDRVTQRIVFRAQAYAEKRNPAD
jgi:hypothetical protein